MSRAAGPGRARILINHWRWLQEQGASYKQQAASCKRQAASLTRKHYNYILEIKGERYDKKRWEEKDE